MTKQEYLDNILDLAEAYHSGNSDKVWAQYPTVQQRAESLATLRLKFYIQGGNSQGEDDTRWAMKKLSQMR